MNFASKIVSDVFAKQLSGGYAWLFLAFVAFCIGFVIWAIYYATVKKGITELTNITWLSFKDVVKYTLLTVGTIIVFSGILFVYDLVLDKLLNLILKNAK